MQNGKQEIQEVFPCFPFFCLRKNLSLSALADLIRVSLKTQTAQPPRLCCFLRRVAADNAHDSFLLLATSLTRPVSAACPPNLFTIHYSLKTPGIVTLQKAWFNTSLREGGGLGRSPKTEGAIGRIASWIAREGTSPKLSHFLCPWKEAAWQNWNRVSVVMSKSHPKSKPSAYRPQAPSVTCGDSSLPEGAMGLVPCHIGVLLMGKRQL